MQIKKPGQVIYPGFKAKSLYSSELYYSFLGVVARYSRNLAEVFIPRWKSFKENFSLGA